MLDNVSRLRQEHQRRREDGHRRHQEQGEDQRDAVFVGRFVMMGIVFGQGSSAVTVAGVGWTRSMTPALASCQALNTLRGDTFSSALVSVW